MKKFINILLCSSLLGSLPAAAGVYRSTANFSPTRNIAPGSDTIKFKYDVVTPHLVKTNTDVYSGFNPNLVTFIITPLASAENYGHLDGAPGAILIGAIVARVRAELHPHENFYKASIIDSEKQLVCEASSSRVLEFDRTFVDKYKNIIEREDYDQKSYPSGSKAALVEFPKKCFTADKKIILKIESVGKALEQGFTRAYTTDTINKKLVNEILEVN